MKLTFGFASFLRTFTLKFCLLAGTLFLATALAKLWHRWLLAHTDADSLLDLSLLGVTASLRVQVDRVLLGGVFGCGEDRRDLSLL